MPEGDERSIWTVWGDSTSTIAEGLTFDEMKAKVAEKPDEYYGENEEGEEYGGE